MIKRKFEILLTDPFASLENCCVRIYEKHQLIGWNGVRKKIGIPICPANIVTTLRPAYYQLGLWWIDGHTVNLLSLHYRECQNINLISPIILFAQS